MNSLTELIITLQGNGDYEGVVKLMEDKAGITEELKIAIQKLEQQNIPVDVVFEQGLDVLGLQ